MIIPPDPAADMDPLKEMVVKFDGSIYAAWRDWRRRRRPGEFELTPPAPRTRLVG